ncbi:MAG: thioredoxin family protein [Bacteroidetes bacterium]|nr:MAG: thioredoxin family protein [Bacteroidota bacterium]
MRFYTLLYGAALVLLGLGWCAAAHAQPRSYRFEQIEALQKVEKRKVLIFFHADWCRYCAIMQNTTFKNDSVVQLLNKKFYFIDFDGESTDSVAFNGHIFRYKPTGVGTGIHELAEQLATVKGKVAYPTLCFLNAENEIEYQQNSFLTASELLAMLKSLR